MITATYAGDGNFLASTSSNSATVVVAAFDFTFTNTGTEAYTAAQGAVASYNFTLTPLYASYAGTVSFSVTGLPAGATASFTPSTIAVGGGATPVVMTVQTAAAIARNHYRPFGRSIVLALLFLPLLAKHRVREKLRGRMLLMVLLMAWSDGNPYRLRIGPCLPAAEPADLHTDRDRNQWNPAAHSDRHTD